MNVKLISVTPDAEKLWVMLLGFPIRTTKKIRRSLDFLDTASNMNTGQFLNRVFMTLEIETTRAIAVQILRHRSFTFQEFSQRYADSSMLADQVPMFDLRRQDTKNRQNSIDDIDPFVKQEFEIKIRRHFDEAMVLYQSMLDAGVAKECARFALL